MTAAELEAWLAQHVATTTGLPPSQIDPGTPLTDFGFESVDALAISGDLEALLGRPLEPTILYEHPTIRALGAHLAAADPVETAARPGVGAAEPIAIIGIGCRFPGGAGPRALWSTLVGGIDAISVVPPDRWDADAFFDQDPLAPGKMSTRWGGFTQDADGFDHGFFRMPFQEAAAMDPQQRALLEVAWEALEDANLRPSALAGADTGVFIGIAHNDYEAIQLRRPDTVSAQSGLGSALSIAANRISYKLDLRGPSLALDTACSSSLVATHLAVQSLRRGECSLALVGGANLILAPEPTIAFSKAGMMAPDGRCKTFASAADGYVRGEGVGVVVLAPLSKAIAANCPVYAVIAGSAVNQDGLTNGLSAPSSGAQEAVLRAAYADADVDPAQVGYVEAHGTGTKLGDPIEALALGRVLGGRGADAAPCLVGSIKSNIGHLEAAAGVAGLIKAALVLEHGLAPPNLHFAEPSPQIDFERLGLRVPTTATPLPPCQGVGVSAFGFGGTNCHVVLKPAPPREPPGALDRPELVVLSARTPEALRAARARLARTLQAPDAPSRLYDVAATLAVGRDHHRHRLAITCRDMAELAQATADDPPRRQWAQATVVRKPKIGFVFPGQGSHAPGASRALKARFPVFADGLERADRLAAPLISRSIVAALDSDDGAALAETRVAQPAIVAMQIALVDLLASVGVQPHAVVGHSLGEIAAAYASGVLDAPSAIRLACERGRAMERPEARGAMLAVRMETAALEARLRGDSAFVAARNSPRDTVLAGPRDALERIAADLSQDGVAHRWMPTDYAFHTPSLRPAAQDLLGSLSWLTPAQARLAFYSTVAGDRPEAPVGPAHWARGIHQPVRFADAVQAMAAEGVDIWLEVSGRPTLTPSMGWLARSEGDPPARLAVISEPEAAVAVLQTLGELHCRGCALDWSAVFPEPPCPIRLPPYAWDRTAKLREHRLACRSEMARQGPAPSTDAWLGVRATDGMDTPVHLWRSDISLATFGWLADHTVSGSVVLPGAAMIDMMATAARQALGRRISLRDLVISQPVLLVGDTAAMLLVKVEQTPAHRRVGLLAKVGGGDWGVVAEASVEFAGNQPRSESAAMAEITSASSDPMAADAFYAALQAIGLNYGPAFRRVARVWRSDGAAAAEFTAAPDGSVQARVTALDAAFQAVAAATPDAPGEPNGWAPVGAASVRLDVEGTPQYALVQAKPSTAGEITAEVRLLDASGTILGEVADLRLRRVNADWSKAGRASPHWFYGEQWEPRPTDEPAPGSSRRWLILADRGGQAARLATALGAAGHRVVLSDAEASPDQLAPHLAPSAERLDGIICLWGLDQPEARAPGAGIVSPMLDRLRQLMRDLSLAHGAHRLWLVTRGAQAVGERQTKVNAWQSPVWGFGFAAAFELPDTRCSRLDLDPATPDPAAQMSETAALIAGDPEGDQFAERDLAIFVRRIIALPSPALQPVRPRADGAYLVTGGLGALGLSVAARLARDGAGHVILLGRHAPSASAAEAIDGLRARGAEITTIAADVADPEGLTRAFEQIRRLDRPLRGVVHAAGVIRDAALGGLDSSSLDDVLRPKVLGAWGLHELTRERPLDFFVLFSSGAAALGSSGQAAYMAANAFLQGLAEKRARAGLPALCVDWGPWADAGMAARAIEAGRARSLAGVSMIDPEEGVETLMRLIAAGTRRAIVLPNDLSDLLHVYPARTGLSLFSRLMSDGISGLRSGGSSEAAAKRPDLAQVYVAPRTKLESAIAGIWQRALGIDEVGVLDPFFELGGDSVFANQILLQIERVLGVALDAEQAFAELTVARLAELAEAAILERIEAMSEEEAANLVAAANS